MGYKQFTRGDPRRYFTALLAVDKLQGADRATVSNVAAEIGSNRAEAATALKALEVQFGVVFEKKGPKYRIVDCGVLVMEAVRGNSNE